MGKIEKRAEALGVEVPSAPVPLAKYVPARQVHDLVYVSGQLPLRDGAPVHEGKLGAGVTVEQGQECARQCAVNCLAAIKAVADDLDRVEEVVEVRGFVNSAPDFADQPEVIDAASELFVDLFGEGGRHARMAVGAASLPRNAPVEVGVVVRLGL